MRSEPLLGKHVGNVEVEGNGVESERGTHVGAVRQMSNPIHLGLVAAQWHGRGASRHDA